MKLLLTSAGIKNTSIDETAIKVTDGAVEVISEGPRKLFTPTP